jgi:hypothetical protein
MNMPSSPRTETGTKLLMSSRESQSAIPREYFKVIECVLYELILKKWRDIIRGLPKSGNEKRLVWPVLPGERL